jgi:hypothetical protein
MDLYIRFLFDFLRQFFNGVFKILIGIKEGIQEIFNIPKYISIIRGYSAELDVSGWILVAIIVVVLAVLLTLIIVLVFLTLKKYMKFRKKIVSEETLLEEVSSLNQEVIKLSQEKDRIMAMKVSQLGLKPGESDLIDPDEEKPTETGEPRFAKLNKVDEDYADYQTVNHNNQFDLPGLCDLFRNFAASQLGLYYKPEMIMLFISALASTKLVILQGISGTGKTSLAYAWGKFLTNDATIASVQPSWRDRTELFGYFNEFTKKFNETEVLKAMYEAGYTDDVYVTVLDEMNIARVEYYFAEMLSILEMPSRDEWLIEIVPSSWDNDPKNLIEGKLKIPPNMWYIGTINNDDSTFMVTDKVYDRAMPLDINDKGQPFDPVPTEAVPINFTYLENLFKEAQEKFPMSEEINKKIEEMDDYVIKHFRIAFGNRIVKHMRDFVPVYVGCGGTEVAAVDYFVARKILRKFEQLNLAYIRDELDGFIKYLDTTFGEDQMIECKEYLLRLKKLV